MPERTEQPPLGAHREIACRPNRWQADIARENRVRRGQIADRLRDLLRMDEIAARFALGQPIEFLAYSFVVLAGSRKVGTVVPTVPALGLNDTSVGAASTRVNSKTAKHVCGLAKKDEDSDSDFDL